MIRTHAITDIMSSDAGPGRTAQRTPGMQVHHADDRSSNGILVAVDEKGLSCSVMWSTPPDPSKHQSLNHSFVGPPEPWEREHRDNMVLELVRRGVLKDHEAIQDFDPDVREIRIHMDELRYSKHAGMEVVRFSDSRVLFDPLDRSTPYAKPYGTGIRMGRSRWPR